MILCSTGFNIQKFYVLPTGLINLLKPKTYIMYQQL